MDPSKDARREWIARLLGVATALASMGTAWSAIGWPAPGLSVALGLGIYVVARPRRS